MYFQYVLMLKDWINNQVSEEPKRTELITVAKIFVIVDEDNSILYSQLFKTLLLLIPKIKIKYLQEKRGIEKPAFDLPNFIKDTVIMEMRER
ncbi:hypothetical protein Glove_469g17 [Diversispora epigaea]|uniref:DUF382 domain-containing protein n=1 Tax=Diversispora epigaea TaxID=1348612 RepID=A0A397GQM7_9GLOM|nr:hypothetical protein Glove_469g17 [Diversispora epigaea]